MPINIRIPSPIGVGMNENTILPTFLRRCLDNAPIILVGNGMRKQDYVDVRDISEMTEKCMSVDSACGCYNIGVSSTISNIDLAKMCKEITGSDSKTFFSGKG